MQYSVLIAIAASALLAPLSARAQQAFYVTQGGRGAQNGTSYADAWSQAALENGANWSTSDSAAAIDPGDVVYLCGTFDFSQNDLRIAGSGTAAADITIRGDCAGSRFLGTGSSSGGSGIHIEDRSYLVLDSLVFRSAVAVEIRVRDSHHIRIRNTSVEKTGRGKAIETSGSGHHLWIHDNVLHATTPGGGIADAIAIWQGPWDHIWIYRNYLSDWNHNGVNLIGFYPETTPPTLNEVSYVYIYENEFVLPTRGYGRAFGFNEPNHVYFYRNLIRGMRSRSQVSSRDTYVYNNVFADTMNCCTYATQNGCSEDYDNCATKTWYGTGQSLSLGDYAAVPDRATVINNLFYGAAEAAILVLGDMPSNVDITNNVFVGSANASTPAFDPPGSEATWTDVSFVTNGAMAGLRFNNNTLQSSRAADIRYNGSNYSVEQFNNLASVNASNNVAGDPLLDGYVPASTRSPIVDSAMALTGPEDPTGGLPADGTYAHALHPSSRWPDGVVVALQTGAWDRGPYVYGTTDAPSENPPSPAPEYSVRRLARAPVIDGDLSEYANAATVALQAGPTTGEYRLAWDEDALYVSLAVTDAHLATAATERDGDLWLDDALELMLDMHADGGDGELPGNDDYKFFVNAENLQRDDRGGGEALRGSWLSAVSTNGAVNSGDAPDVGYTVELRIPWEVLGVTAPAVGLAAGLELNLNDRRPDGDRAYDVWANRDGGSLNNPAGWGRFVLSGDTIRVTEEAPPTANVRDGGQAPTTAEGTSTSSSSCNAGGAPPLAAIAWVLVARRRWRAILRATS